MRLVLKAFMQNNGDFIEKSCYTFLPKKMVSHSSKLRSCYNFYVSGGALADGLKNRYFEFQDFERKFEECISKSAVRTKFEQHSQRGKLIVSEIRQIIDSTCDQAQQLRTEKAVAKKEIYVKLKFKEQQLLLLRQEMRDKIQQMVDYVKQKVSCFRGTSVTCT